MDPQAEILNRETISPRMRDFAQQLLAHEALAHSSSEPHVAAAVSRVCETLRRPLSMLVGVSGFRALLARALTLANAQVPGLSAVHVTPDGSLEGLSGLRNNSEDLEPGVALTAHLLGLLVTFIGESLTLHLLAYMWPSLTIFDTELSGDSEHEPRK